MNKKQRTLRLEVIALYAIGLAEYFKGNYLREFYCHLAELALLRRPRQ